MATNPEDARAGRVGVELGSLKAGEDGPVVALFLTVHGEDLSRASVVLRKRQALDLSRRLAELATETVEG